MANQIGRYEIREKLGEGGMADVYAAHDPNFDRAVVVKVIKREYSAQPDFRARFSREAKVIAGLEHEAIVPVYDFGEQDGQPFIVMRQMTGGSLADRLAQGPLELNEVAPVVERIADALDYAHSRGIIHRDLKPGNILFDGRGKAFLSDFGIAKMAEATTKLTGTGIIGTPAYMSPEQARAMQDLDRRSDVYSLGVVVFELLTGELPFKAREPMGMALAHLTEPVPDIRKVRPGLPRESDTVIRRAMAKKPDERYATTGQFSVDLSKIATKPTGKAWIPPTQVEKTPTPPKLPPVPAALAGDYRLTGSPKAAAAPPPNRKWPRWQLWAIPAILVSLCGLVVLVGGILAVPGFLSRLTPAPTSVAANDNPTALPTNTPNTGTVSTSPPETAAPVNVTAPPEACAQPVELNTASASTSKLATIGFAQEPEMASGLFSSAIYAAWTAQLTQASLAKWDEQNNFVPDLAEAIPTIENGGLSSDGLTITWRLKNCLFWSDGQPLTAADITFTWKAIMDSGNTPVSRAGYDQIASIEAVDDRTVIIKFRELYPAWQALFTQGTYYSGALLPQHILQGQTGLESKPEIRQPSVSAGPFVIKDWVVGDHLTLVANPNYAGGHPRLDAVKIIFLPDSATALTALQTGQIDFYPDFTEADILPVGGLEPQVFLQIAEGSDVEHYLFNLGTTRGVNGVGKSDVDGFCPFQDVRVRKAIILGINRQLLIDSQLGSKIKVPASLWPNSPWTNGSLEPYPYDPAQAAQLLEEAGYRLGSDGIRTGLCDGRPVKLSFNFETTPRQFRMDTAATVKNMLSEIGIEFNPVFTPAGDFFGTYTDGANMETGKFDMAGFTNGFYPNPFTDMFLCSTVPSRANTSGSNLYHLCDPTLDDLFTQLNSSADPAARKPIMDEIQQYMYDNVLIIPIYTRAAVFGYRDGFNLGFVGSSSYGGWAWNAAAWDISN